jgi:hypothetical protein
VSAVSSAAVQAPQDPALTLVKTAAPTVAHAGDRVTYSFRMTNTGDVTLHDLSPSERAFTGSGRLPVIDCPATAALAPLQTLTCTADYTVTSQDVKAGTIRNTATASGLTAHAKVAVAPASTAKVTTVQPPSPSPYPSPTASVPSRVEAGFAGARATGNALLALLGAVLAAGAATAVLLLTRRRRGYRRS